MAMVSGLVACSEVPGTKASQPAWEFGWASSGQAPEEWTPTTQPFVERSGPSADVWFRSTLSRPPDEDTYLFVGFMPRPFEVFLEERLIFRFDPAWSSGAPIHFIRLGHVTPGQRLRLHTWVPWRRYGGFRFGVTVGSSASIYETIAASGGPQLVLGLITLVVAFFSLACQYVVRPKGNSPFIWFAGLAGASGLQFVIRSPLSHLFFREGLDLGYLGFVLMPVIPAFEALYIAAVLPAPPRRLCRAVATLFFAEALFMVLQDALKLASFAQTAQVHEVLETAFSLLVLVIGLSNLRSGGWLTRAGIAGLLVYRGSALYEVVFSLRNDYAPQFVAQYGFAGLTAFLLTSLLLTAHLENRRKAEEREKNARALAVAETTQMFAHDVRTPFSLLRSAIDLLEGIEHPSEMKRLVRDLRGDVLRATRSVDAMIQDILEVASEASLKTTPVEVTALLDSSLKQLIQSSARTLDVRFSFDLQHTHKLEVHQAKIERVLSNIVGNALEAMHGVGDLWFKTRRVQLRGRPFVELTVGNSNSSIPAERIPRLFDSFFTADKKGGTGLGLAIAHKIVTAHGGEIVCKSEKAKGVEFVFTLPESTVRAPMPLPVLPASSAEVLAVSGLAKRFDVPERVQPPANGYVVLVEDSRIMQHAWRRRVPDGALKVFGSPSLLLAAAEQDATLLRDAVCLVLDNRFGPGELLGEELAVELKRRTNVPILLSSEESFTQNLAGIDACLPKEGHSLEELRRVVHDILTTRASADTRGPEAQVNGAS